MLIQNNIIRVYQDKVVFSVKHNHWPVFNNKFTMDVLIQTCDIVPLLQTVFLIWYVLNNKTSCCSNNPACNNPNTWRMNLECGLILHIHDVKRKDAEHIHHTLIEGIHPSHMNVKSQNTCQLWVSRCENHTSCEWTSSLNSVRFKTVQKLLIKALGDDDDNVLFGTKHTHGRTWIWWLCLDQKHSWQSHQIQSDSTWFHTALFPSSVENWSAGSHHNGQKTYHHCHTWWVLMCFPRRLFVILNNNLSNSKWWNKTQWLLISSRLISDISSIISVSSLIWW